jgi:hypothetical protein
VKISPATIKALRTLRIVNPRLSVQPGNRLFSVSHRSQIMCIINVPDTFPVAFNLYDVGQLLSILSLFKEPDIDFFEQYLTVTGEGGRVRFWYSTDVNTRGTLNEEKIAALKAKTEFKLDGAVLATAINAAKALHLDTIQFYGDGTHINVAAVNEGVKTAHNFSQPVCESNLNFYMLFKVDRLGIISGTTNVRIINNTHAQFITEDGSYLFMLAAEIGNRVDV